MNPKNSGSGRGAASLALRARPEATARALAALSPAFLGLLLPPAVVALVDGAPVVAAALAAPSLAFAALWAVGRRSPPPSDLRGIEGLATIALAFLLASLAAAPAFRALGMPPAAALFEAVSAVTTTGLSAEADAAAWPLAGHVLRAWLQWWGGLAFLASAFALVLGPGAVAARLGELGVGSSDDLLASTRTRARALLGFYAGFTVVVAVGCAATAREPVEGALVALAAVSTAGFSPRADSLAGEGGAFQIIAFAACLIGALSFPLLIGLRRGSWRRLLRDPAVRLLAMLFGGGALAAFGLQLAADPGADWARAAQVAAATAASALSTAGFSVSEMGALPPAALAVLVALMVVGGDVGSTAGGLKVARVVAALAALRTTIARTQTPPGAVTPVRALDHRIGGDEIAALAALATAYAIGAGALWVALMSVGAPPLPALFDTVSALSTVGLSAGVVGPDLGWPLQLAAAAAMLFGRLEFFALIALLRPATWAPIRR